MLKSIDKLSKCRYNKKKYQSFDKKQKENNMALIKCPECGNEVSDKAKTCPHCGYELNAALENSFPAVQTPVPAQGKQPSASANAAQKSAPAPKVSTERDLGKAWEAACPADVKRKKSLRTLDIFLGICVGIPLLLLLLQLTDVILPLNKETLFEPGYAVKCKNFIDDVFTAGIVLSCAAFVVRFVLLYWKGSAVARWLKKGEFDAATYFKKMGGKWYLEAYCAFAPHGKVVLGIYCLSFSFTQIDFIFLGWVLHEGAIARLEYMLIGSDISLSAMVVPLIVLSVFSVLSTAIILATYFICKNFIKKRFLQG